MPGVAEVASVGGQVRQYQVEVDPNQLTAYGLSLSHVRHAIKRSNADIGGKLLEQAETEFMVRGRGYVESVAHLEEVAVGASESGTPILLKNVATVSLGPELRRGLTDLNGEGDVAAGVVIMRFGENALETIRNVKEKLSELADNLPPGVEIVPVYDRAPLIERAIDNLREKLLQQGLIVALICFPLPSAPQKRRRSDSASTLRNPLLVHRDVPPGHQRQHHVAWRHRDCNRHDD